MTQVKTYSSCIDAYLLKASGGNDVTRVLLRFLKHKKQPIHKKTQLQYVDSEGIQTILLALEYSAYRFALEKHCSTKINVKQC